MVTKNAKAGEGVQLAEIIDEQSVKNLLQICFNQFSAHSAARRSRPQRGGHRPLRKRGLHHVRQPTSANGSCPAQKRITGLKNRVAISDRPEFGRQRRQILSAKLGNRQNWGFGKIGESEKSGNRQNRGIGKIGESMNSGNRKNREIGAADKIGSLEKSASDRLSVGKTDFFAEIATLLKFEIPCFEKLKRGF